MNDLLEAAKVAVAGQYEIVREVGRGGMAIVFLARDVKHDRMVALKMLRPELAVTLATDRFLREIRIAAGLSHPHILALYDSGVADGHLYYVTPFVEGESLREHLNRHGTLSVDRAVSIARDVASALSYAHARGIVHRDIKPGNILVTAKESVVADFGIARAIAEGGDERLTESGFAIGTMTYMAPEQAVGQVDARSDIYSLGCTLYEMLAGRPPFGGATGVMLMAQHAQVAATPIRSVRAEVPLKLAALLDRALAKDPRDRFATADEFLDALSEVSGIEPVTRPSPQPTTRLSRPGWRLVGGSVAVLAIVAAVGVFVARRMASPTPNETPTIAVFPFRVEGALDTSIVSPEALVDLLYARLPGDGGPRAIHPRVVMQAWEGRRFRPERPPSPEELRRIARALGASEMLVGESVGASNRVELSGIVYSVRTGAILSQLRAAGPSDSILTVIDELAAELLIKEAGEGHRRLTNLLTEQLPALRAYLSGLGNYRRGRYVASISDFRRALELDSAFALAAIELASAQTMAGSVDGEDQTALRLAWASRRRLSTRDSVYLSLHLGPRYPRQSGFADQLRAWEGFLSKGPARAPLAPERWEAWYFFADMLFHNGPYVGIASPHVLARNAFRQALKADSALAPALEHLIELAAAAHDWPDVQALARLYFSVDSSGDNAAYVRWRLATFPGRESDRAAIRASLPGMPTSALRRIVGAAQLESVALDDAVAAAEELRKRARNEVDQYVAASTQRELALNRGQPHEATVRQLDTPQRVRLPIEPLFRVVAAAYWGGDTSDASRVVAARERALASARTSRDSAAVVPLMMDVCTVALWRLSRGDTRNIEESIRELSRFPAPLDRTMTTYIALCRSILEARLGALVPAARARASTAVAYLDSLMRSGPETNPYMKFAANWTIAEMLEASGDARGALVAVRRRPYQNGHGVVGLSTLLRHEGRLAAAAGDTTGAIDAYERYLRLRSAPEREMVPQADSVRQELARLSVAKADRPRR